MTCLNIDYGPMRTHELNAAKGDLYTTPERPFENAAEMKFNPDGKVIDLVIPVIILIIGCVSSMIYVGFRTEAMTSSPPLPTPPPLTPCLWAL